MAKKKGGKKKKSGNGIDVMGKGKKTKKKATKKR